MDLLIALIPALPLAGFLFAVLVGPRLDHVPVTATVTTRRVTTTITTAHDAHDVDDSAFRGRPHRGGAGAHQPASPATPTTSPMPRVPRGHPAGAQRRARPDRTRHAGRGAPALSVVDRTDRPGGRHVDPQHDRVRERDLRRERVRGHRLRVDLVGRLPRRDQLPRRRAHRDAAAGRQHGGLPRPRLLDRLHGRRPRASGASSRT